MDTSVSKEQIQNALKTFAGGNLRDNARHLFNTLGYRSEKRIDLSPNTAEAFLDHFDPEKKLNIKTALLNHWRSVDLLFPLTSDEINQSVQGRLTSHEVNRTAYLSYLFFSIELGDNQYTRTQLAAITRAVFRLRDARDLAGNSRGNRKANSFCDSRHIFPVQLSSTHSRVLERNVKKRKKEGVVVYEGDPSNKIE